MSPANRGTSPGGPVNDPLTSIVASAAAHPSHPSLGSTQADVLREMAIDWEQGIRTRAEEWLNRYPHLAAQAETAVQIVYEEICLRLELGDEVTSEEICRRFPQWSEELRILFDCHRVIDSGSVAPRYPQAGESLGELQLVRKLGRGAVGQVFLARQPSLSDRSLVVKLTPRVGDEHLSLARLQHTHIVPLYHVLDFPQQQLRALCMPYLGGVTWAHLLATFRNKPVEHISGRNIVEALIASESDRETPPSQNSPALAFLSRATYTQAVCWLGGCVADALQHAHECGMVHLDVKPSNILLASDGQPMLLDFHLASEVMLQGSQPPSRIGGTRGYMSPEQEAAADDVRQARPLRQDVDRRSDIYSLGVTLYESLAGGLPPCDEISSREYWRRHVPNGSRGLEDIVHKCLATRTSERYSDAARLAADLRRHLTDLPLVGVPNRSLAERWQKWRRRKPHALAGMGALLTVVAVTTISLALLGSDRASGARLAFDQATQSINNREFGVAIEQLEASSRAIRWLPGQSELKKSIEAQMVVARRGRIARAVHDLVEQIRFLDSYDSVALDQLKQLDGACEKLWSARDKLAPLLESTANPAERTAFRSDLVELVTSWAALKAKLASSDESVVHREANLLLDQAGALCGPGFAIDLARLEHSGDRPPDAVASMPLKPHTPGEHYAMGRHLFRADKLQEATEQFELAVQSEPNAFWPRFYLALCAFRLEHFEQAVHESDVCIALSPSSAHCYYNRALCHQALGEATESLRDLTRAIQLDPTLSVAWFHRGMVRRELRQFAAAIDDFKKALEHAAKPAEVYYEMALVEVDQGNSAAALDYLRQALQHDAAHASALALRDKLQSISSF